MAIDRKGSLTVPLGKQLLSDLNDIAGSLDKTTQQYVKEWVLKQVEQHKPMLEKMKAARKEIAESNQLEQGIKSEENGNERQPEQS
ncbi:MAG: hypothetical protein WBM11_11825 [Terriglobales bacterium]